MDDKIISELQKLYDNNKVGALVQEICEYYATREDYEDNSYEDEIEPPEIVESAYILFCLQSRERILDEFALVRKRYPSLYESIRHLDETILINMDYRSLESSAASVISGLVEGSSSSDIIAQAEICSRSSNSLSEALDKFYKYLHAKKR
ncbi:MAG: hypothetical protein K6G10_00825 [Butyrivibrio sp.]|nr:hypothetical protein [Butyrivibrio sp.]